MRDEQKYANVVDMVRDYNIDKSLILNLTQRIAELEEQLRIIIMNIEKDMHKNTKKSI